MNKAISSVLRFARDWTLPISMLTGVIAYFSWVNIPGHEVYNALVNSAIAWIQPVLIFAMLFVFKTFSALISSAFLYKSLNIFIVVSSFYLC